MTPRYMRRDGIWPARPVRFVSYPSFLPRRDSPSTPTSKGLARSRAVGSPFGMVLRPLPGRNPSPSQVLVLRPVAALAAAPSAVTPPCASLALTAAAQPLPRPLRLLHRTHLVERALHGLEGTVRLPALERLHPLARVPTPVAALAPEALHLVEQLAQLLGRDVRRKPAQQRLGLFEDHLVLRAREVRPEIRQPIHLLQRLKPLVALLQEAVEVGPLARQRGVLEDRREVARGRPATRATALGEVALLERWAFERGRRQRP